MLGGEARGPLAVGSWLFPWRLPLRNSSPHLRLKAQILESMAGPSKCCCEGLPWERQVEGGRCVDLGCLGSPSLVFFSPLSRPH